MHHSAIYDPSVAITPSERNFADERRKRLARIDRRAYVPVAPQKIEIVDSESEPTSIEVTACNGQIVIVNDRQIAEARVVFERANTLGGTKYSIDHIQRMVCKKFGITQLDMLSSRRTRNLTVPRQIAMYLCKTMTFKSLPEIGRRFNGRDHTTVLHAIRKMAHLVQVDAEISETVSELQAQLGGVAD